MLHKVGLLPAGNFQQVPFAYRMYKRADDIGWEQSTEFKKVFCVDVPIEFVGVWFVFLLSLTASETQFQDRDTVDSVGIIPRRLPFTTSNTIVRTFRHAVSLDERRAKFKANLWNRPTSEESKLGTDTMVVPGGPIHDSKVIRNNVGNENKTPGEKSKKKEREDLRDKHLNTLERLYSQSSDRLTDVLEVWFAVRSLPPRTVQ